MSPDYLQYSPNSMGANPGALFQVQPFPFTGTGAACDWTRAASGHTSCIQACLCDGSVRTISQGIAATTWWYAFTRDGGEAMPGDWQS
jgi:hypothetical protein